jgi:uncharacterized membrane protein
MTQNLKDYLNKRHKPENVNVKHKQSLAFQNKIALVITTAIGTMYSVYLFMIIMAGWMLWQSLTKKPFDPFPFAFLLFLGNIIQLLLMPLIMVGQNIQGQHSELRANEEFRTTQTIYKDIEKILVDLNNLKKELSSLKKK